MSRLATWQSPRTKSQTSRIERFLRTQDQGWIENVMHAMFEVKNKKEFREWKLQSGVAYIYTKNDINSVGKMLFCVFLIQFWCVYKLVVLFSISSTLNITFKS